MANCKGCGIFWLELAYGDATTTMYAMCIHWPQHLVVLQLWALSLKIGC